MAAVIAAVARTAIGILVFWTARFIGFAPDTTLLAGLAVAGALNIHALASLNLDRLLPTSGASIGEG